MSILLIGYMNDSGHLIITRSLPVEDEAAVSAIVGELHDASAWAATFDEPTHKRAIQQAFEEYVRDEWERDPNTRLIDEVEHYEPSTD
ncbi:hypothetical protein [Streptomyces buecherae]|uniref:hypothetical protein n=1 Tax=Streptomyces buecherae TaxID=2763006 RepID=UPI00164CF4AB|nr:hypothetical protein [Streptomyces buecherae]QNJ42008.1 hypothetical protein H7H31_21240 [Streptomyces buecherae]